MTTRPRLIRHTDGNLRDEDIIFLGPDRRLVCWGEADNLLRPGALVVWQPRWGKAVARTTGLVVAVVDHSFWVLWPR